MSKIEQLIKELCPGGVENAKLIRIADILYGCPFDSSLFTEDDSFIPLIRIRDVLPGIPSTYYKGEYQDQYIIKKGDILVGMDGNFNLGRWNSIDGVLCQRTCKISSKSESIVLNNYLYHLLGPLFKNIEENTPGGSVKHLSAKIINGIEIPLPPLPIQEEIVRILDTFTEAQANLEQELELRKKQYEYYRNQLLTFDENDPSVKWMTLGDCGKMIKGNGILKSDFVDSGVPCIHYGQLHTYYGLSATSTISYISEGLAKKSRFAHKGDLVIATTSEDVEACCKACAWLGEEAVAVSGDAHIFVHDQNPKYMAYLFRTNDFAKQKQVAATGAKVTRVSGDNMLKFKFLFPSKERQQEIVSILDKFESAIQTLEEELALRKKQYEYYREKLLTFN